MRNERIKVLIIWVLAAVPMLMTIAAYPFLPDEIPLHWNVMGEVDRTGLKFPSAFLMPGICLLIPALMTILPKFDPKRENYEKFGGVYYWMKLFFVVLFGIINTVILLISLGMDFIRVDFVIKLVIGILIMVIGNLMPKIKHNYFVGIKTPWTFASEEVWFATHRHGGILWFAAGLIMSVLAFIPGLASAYIYFGVVIIAAIEPMIYSYMKYRRR